MERDFPRPYVFQMTTPFGSGPVHWEVWRVEDTPEMVLCGVSDDIAAAREAALQELGAG